MLVNGTTLKYKKKGAAEYTDISEFLKEIPEMGIEMEKVENTPINAKNNRYENGIGDIGDLTYKFCYENESDSSVYRVMRKAQETGEILSFQETLIDGTTTEVDGQVMAKRTGGGKNGEMEVNLTITPCSDLIVTDPTA